MKTILTSIVAIGLSAGSLWAGEVPPSEVKFEDGAIPQSLTGQPGDPERGREIVSSKSLGNCVACHEVAALSDIPFQGQIGPPLDGTGERWTEAELRGIVANAKVMFPESMMPSFYKVHGFIRPGKAYTGKAADETFGPLLTAQQVEDVVAYLTTLKE